jgi:hypothetical protein
MCVKEMVFAKAKFSIASIALLLNLALLIVQLPEPGLGAPTKPFPLPAGLIPFSICCPKNKILILLEIYLFKNTRFFFLL